MSITHFQMQLEKYLRQRESRCRYIGWTPTTGSGMEKERKPRRVCVCQSSWRFTCLHHQKDGFNGVRGKGVKTFIQWETDNDEEMKEEKRV